MSSSDANQNLTLALSACRSFGLNLNGVIPSDFVKKVPFLILDTVWQLLRNLWNEIGDHPFLERSYMSFEHSPLSYIRLMEADEEMEDFVELKTEAILIRWINYLLRDNG